MENLTLDIETLDSATTLTWTTVGTSSDILTAMLEEQSAVWESLANAYAHAAPFTADDLDWFRRPLNATIVNGGNS